MKDLILISEENKELTGFALGLLITYADFTYGTIEELYVAPPFRKLGIASALIKEMIERLRTLGAESVIILTNDKNKSAIKLYNKLGFKRSTYAYIRRLQN